MPWKFADIVRVVEEAVDPASPALLHGDRAVAWAELTARSNALADAFAAGGAEPGDKVAHYMRNSPEYLETSMACFKAGLTHVNVNYRYTSGELFHIFDNSDAAVIVYAREFAANVAELQPRLAKVKLFVEIGEGAPENAFAQSYDDLADGGAPAPSVAIPDDPMVFIYTGGTTGLPKGVMWRQQELWQALTAALPGGLPDSLEAYAQSLKAGGVSGPAMICPPLMHGAGYLIALSTLLKGGAVVTVPGANFDAGQALTDISRHKPNVVVIVGDAFGRPLQRALEAAPEAYDLSSVVMMISSGAMWSPEIKAGIAAHNPRMMLMDALGSSEVLGMGASMSTAATAAAPTKFMRDPRTRVITDDGREVEPGSGEIGRIHRGGPAPMGYYKDPEKSAKTFVTIGEARYVVPGDYATVDPDGAIRLLGRGNQVINTGGEKVFVEEVEEALKSHPAVDDALVFGVADEKWGQAVTAVVEARAEVSPEELVAHVRQSLAPYKSPKRIIFAKKAPRGPNGKANYDAARALASA
jgi:3-oxocholest-4-en-26-oate---CoA ligase